MRRPAWILVAASLVPGCAPEPPAAAGGMPGGMPDMGGMGDF